MMKIPCWRIVVSAAIFFCLGGLVTTNMNLMSNTFQMPCITSLNATATDSSEHLTAKITDLEAHIAVLEASLAKAGGGASLAVAAVSGGDKKSDDPYHCSSISDKCTRIQCTSWSQSWNAVDKESQKEWYDLDCRDKLRVRPLETPTEPNCKSRTAAMKSDSHNRIATIKDKYAGADKKCVLMGNGPSLNKMRWDWQDHVDVVMGTNKIYLGVERYNISKLALYASCNPLVMEQSRDEMWSLGNNVEKFLRHQPELFPCEAAERGLHFTPSTSNLFSTDPRKGLNEGWTVTYWSLQVLYYVGCEKVYIIGMDHSFAQKGKPNEMNKMTNDDPNHFDPSYFKGNNWHNADLEKSELHYKHANDFYNKNGRKIYDATPGGKCDIFAKVDWEKALYE